jgi:hypothetical protein
LPKGGGAFMDGGLCRVIVKPPALYRSPVFWLGAFVLLFLVWVWAGSMRTGRSASRMVVMQGPVSPEKKRREWSYYDDGVMLDGGKLMLVHTSVKDVPSYVTVHYDPVITMSFPAESGSWAGRFRWGPHHDNELDLPAVRRHFVEVSMWGIVGSYLVIAGGIIGWRRRRWRRLAGDSAVMNSAA